MFSRNSTRLLMVAIMVIFASIVQGGLYNPYPGEKFISTGDCMAKTGILFLDTCLVPGPTAATWQDSWNACYQQQSRLLEIRDSNSNDAYMNLSSPIFNPTSDRRWLEFRHSKLSQNRVWCPGQMEENVTWIPESSRFSVQSTPDDLLCGYVVKRSYWTWAERACYDGTAFPYLCYGMQSQTSSFATTTVSTESSFQTTPEKSTSSSSQVSTTLEMNQSTTTSMKSDISTSIASTPSIANPTTVTADTTTANGVTDDTPMTKTCKDNNGIAFEGACYIFVPVSKNWCRAMQYCASMGGHLAHLMYNQTLITVNQYLDTVANYSTDTVWFGLATDSLPVQLNEYYWAFPKGYLTVDPAETNNWMPNLIEGTEYCVKMIRSTGWKWMYEKCSAEMAFICQIEPAFPNFCDGYPCENGGHCIELINGPLCVCPMGYSGSHCEIYNSDQDTKECIDSGGSYAYIGTTKIGCWKLFNGPMTWGNAMDKCNRMGGYLANASYMTNLKNIMQSNGISQAWLGIKAGQRMITPTLTSNNEIYNNGNWCGALILANANQVSQMSCENAMAYICEMPNGIQDCISFPCMNGGTCIEGMNSFTCQCPTPYAGSQCESKMNMLTPDLASTLTQYCQANTGTMISEYCYQYMNTEVTFDEAISNCMQMGGQLASLHSPAVVQSLMQSQNIPLYTPFLSNTQVEEDQCGEAIVIPEGIQDEQLPERPANLSIAGGPNDCAIVGQTEAQTQMNTVDCGDPTETAGYFCQFSQAPMTTSTISASSAGTTSTVGSSSSEMDTTSSAVSQDMSTTTSTLSTSSLSASTGTALDAGIRSTSSISTTTSSVRTTSGPSSTSVKSHAPITTGTSPTTTTMSTTITIPDKCSPSSTMSATTQTPSGANDCSMKPCRNGGTCIDLKNNTAYSTYQYMCQCTPEFTGMQCEAPVNQNPNCNLQQFCNESKGAEIGGYCYVPQQPAPASDQSQICANKNGELMQSPSPELMSSVLESLNLPPETAMALGIKLIVDECGRSVPDPSNNYGDILATLGPMLFSGSGCAVLQMMSPGTYEAIGGDCSQASQFLCKYSAPPPPPPVVSTPPAPIVQPKFLTCKRINCVSEGTQTCDRTGQRCICKPGWQGVVCAEKIQFCDPNPCKFRGKCIVNKAEDGYRCECISGFTGINCSIANGISTDPIQIYNTAIQKLGCMWVLISSGGTSILYLALYDGTPEGTLKRHSLHALFLEHLLIALFHSPAMFSLTREYCSWASLGMLFFRGAHMTLALFQSMHIYYIMTGVTIGEWGWNGSRWPFLLLGWGGPAVVCYLIYDYHFYGLSTGFSCMLDWDSHGPRWLNTMIFGVLLSILSLEEAFMMRKWQQICTKYIVDEAQLEVAKVGRVGSIFVVEFAPCSYLFSSLAVYTGDPTLYTIAFACNVILGIAIVFAYVISNPHVWAFLKRGMCGLWSMIKSGMKRDPRPKRIRAFARRIQLARERGKTRTFFPRQQQQLQLHSIVEMDPDPSTSVGPSSNTNNNPNKNGSTRKRNRNNGKKK